MSTSDDTRTAGGADGSGVIAEARANPNPRDRERVVVTGATGYIGGRLAPRLLEAGYPIRCLVRSPGKLSDRTWASDPRVEIRQDDLSDEDALVECLRGARSAYYLIHSMASAKGEYANRDQIIAERFARAAERAGLERIIYLGGLGEMGEDLSEHLRSRRRVEQALATGSTPVTVLRAAMIIGSGSASFEILRYLVERLPVMVTPRWVRTESQPISIRNVLHYLTACLDTPETVGRTLDIGGADVVTYRRLMKHMQEARGLPKRLVVPVPVLTPRLSSLWIHLVTPISSSIARPLAEGLRNRVVCRDDEAARLMPQRLLNAREAIDAALGKMAAENVETTWSWAGPIPGDPNWAGGTVYEDAKSIEIAARPSAVYRAVCRVGGGHGWYAADWLWRLRGVMDRLVGGPGLRRGRRHPEHVSYGDALDFWRVTAAQPAERLSLRAEMRLPGEALLEFRIEPFEKDGRLHSRLTQIARFKPKGLLGLAYWWAVYPLHGVVFNGMLKGIRRAAEADSETTSEDGGQTNDASAPEEERAAST